MNYIISIKKPSDYLMHYGVKGMKWGVRKDYVPKGEKRQSKKDDNLLLDIALENPQLVVGAAALAVWGVKRISDLNKQGWFTEKYTAEDVGRTNTTKDEDLKIVNPVPNVSDKIFDKLGQTASVADLSTEEQEIIAKAMKDGWFDNCVYCTTAAALRRKGYDVEAKNSPGRGHTSEQTMKWWKGSKIANFDGEETSEPSDAFDFQTKSLNKQDRINRDKAEQLAHMESVLKKQGVGAYGDMRAQTYFLGGHSFEYAVEKEGVMIYDNQVRTKYRLADYFNKMDHFNPNSAVYIRLDNCEPDLNRMLREHAVKPRGK